MKAKDLKNSILQMAVQGKLVPQDSSDESASVLLERIRKERARLIKEKKIKAPKGGESIIYRASDKKHYEKWVDAKGRESEPVCIEDEIPFEIPESWEWVRLGDIGDWKAGATPLKGESRYYLDGEIPWLLTGDLNDGLITDIPNRITKEALNECSLRLNPVGSVLLAMYGATIGKTGVLALDATTNQACCACILHDERTRDWLLTWLQYQKPHFVRLGEGGAQPNISRQKIVSSLMAVPPLNEQIAIEDKLSEVLPLSDQYDALETAREQLDAELPDRLRKSILQMAVQGKLVPQDPNDEPASVLLERIREQRRQLIAEGKIKAPKGGESVIYRGSDGGYYEKYGEKKPVPLKAPFDIPASWEWTRMSSLIQLLSGVDLEAKQYNENQNGIPYLTGASNFNQGCLVENRWTDSPKRISRRGDLLFTCKGTVGEMAVNPFEEAHIARQIMAISPHDQSLLNYLRIFLSAMVVEIKTKAKGVIPSIERNTLLDALVPLPPKVEQQRIVQRSEALLELCS